MSATLLGAVVFLVLMAGLFVPLEYLAPGANHRATARSMAIAAALFILNTVLMELLGGPLLDALSSVVSAPASRSPGRVIFVFFAADLLGYWIHRAMHRVPLLWRFHEVHHEAVSLHWLDAWRQHPVDFVVHGLVVGLPGVVLGASLSDLGSVVLLRKAFTTLLHANVRWNFGPLYWLVTSPVFHQRHHSADRHDHDSHFAGTFPLWDLLFGTAKLERPANTPGLLSLLTAAPRRISTRPVKPSFRAMEESVIEVRAREADEEGDARQGPVRVVGAGGQPFHRCHARGRRQHRHLHCAGALG